MDRIDPKNFRESVDANDPGFWGKATYFAEKGEPFVVLNYRKRRDQPFCDMLSKKFRLFWIDDPHNSRLFLSHRNQISGE